MLGSATPSLETFVAAREGRLGLLTLPDRATARPLPRVEVVDLKQHKGGAHRRRSCRRSRETLAAGEQAILFLNRRGFSTFSLCKACGEAVRCRHCSVALTYHRGDDRLLCHYCGFYGSAVDEVRRVRQAGRSRSWASAPSRSSSSWRVSLPGARSRGSIATPPPATGWSALLDAFRARQIDVLVGTQMVTKGHDFPGVTLVGVVLADQGLSLPDFRASERTFQLLAQVAGRAGRGERAGARAGADLPAAQPTPSPARAITTTRASPRPSCASRVEPRYPPHTRMACVRVDGADPLLVRDTAMRAADGRARGWRDKAPAERRRVGARPGGGAAVAAQGAHPLAAVRAVGTAAPAARARPRGDRGGRAPRRSAQHRHRPDLDALTALQVDLQ